MIKILHFITSSTTSYSHHSNYKSQTCTFHPAITSRRKLDISSKCTIITNLPNTIITADVNAHSPLWYSPTKDHKEELIEDILLNSNYITLNSNTPTFSTTQSNTTTYFTRHHYCFSRLA